VLHFRNTTRLTFRSTRMRRDGGLSRPPAGMKSRPAGSATCATGRSPGIKLRERERVFPKLEHRLQRSAIDYLACLIELKVNDLESHYETR